MFSDFDVHRIRKQMARIDKLSPAPRGVNIEPLALSHCEAQWVRPKTKTDRVVLYFPGGAWVLRSPAAHRRLAAKLAKSANAQVLLVFYRLAPEHPFPAALEDCIEGYQTLLDMGIAPARVIIGGDSAGGNLTLGSLLALRDRGLPNPAGAFALSPCTDMSFKEGGIPVGGGDLDPMFPEPTDDAGGDPRRLYAGGDDDVLDNPYASPVRGKLDGLCPLLVQVGRMERLLEHSTIFVEKARAAGVDAEVEVWEGQPHVFQSMPFPESKLAFEHLSDFIRHRCP
jgi:acetyl esterase/lipase